MAEFATLASPYSMPAALHGDVDLTDSSAQSRSRALNQFLASVELKAFKIAQAALRHEDDALDAVQDAMLQLARAYAERPPQEWKPLFYRILENRIRDMQRRRTVRGRVIAWLPFRGEDEEDEADPISQAPSPEPQPVKRLELEEAMGALRAGAGRAAAPPAAGLSAAHARGHGRGRDRRSDGLFGRQRQDPLFPRTAVTARASRRVLPMSPVQEPLTAFERNARTVLEEGCSASMRARARA